MFCDQVIQAARDEEKKTLSPLVGQRSPFPTFRVDVNQSTSPKVQHSHGGLVPIIFLSKMDDL